MSIVLLHLMESHRIRLKLAYDHVRTYRMVAQPNEGFRFQLATTEVRTYQVQDLLSKKRSHHSIYLAA